ncbi:MAG TPA: hypothetical protein PLC06_07740 [Promineifilum sp.]|nr:hypothetical protein [Promineifilum sp.]
MSLRSLAFIGPEPLIVEDEPPGGWVPTLLANAGTGYLTYEGSFGTWAPDASSLDLAFLVGGLDGNPNANCYIFQNHGDRVRVRFMPDGKLHARLQDASATPVDLVDWTSSAGVDAAGVWLFHVAAALSGTPSFTVYKIEVQETSPGVWETVGSWAAITGTFATGPVAGTIDIARNFSGPDLGIFATVGGASIPDCDFGYLWLSSASPLANSAFADGGLLIDPALAGTPAILIKAPNVTDGQGTANLTFVGNGAWV